MEKKENYVHQFMFFLQKLRYHFALKAALSFCIELYYGIHVNSAWAKGAMFPLSFKH